MAEKKVTCPHCNASVVFKRSASGRWVGTLAGGGLGYAVAASLGIAGAIAGAPVAIPAAVVGVVVFAIFGNRAGKAIDNHRAKCPKCKKSMVL